MEQKRLKFFAYSPMFGRSHTTFMGALSDALIEQGHEVVLFAPLFSPSNGSHGTSKARIIEYPTCAAAREREEGTKQEGGIITDFWQAKGTVGSWEAYRPFKLVLVEQLKELLDDKQLIAILRAEKFDAGFSETVDFGSMVFMHLLGIKNYSLAISVPTYDWGFEITGAPFMSSYVPGIMTSFGEQMSFMERIDNLRTLRYTTKNEESEKVKFRWMESIYKLFDDMVKPRLPDFPGVKSMLASSSFVFLNTDPLFDFPRPTVHKVVEIGGISVDCEPKGLDEFFTSLLSLRNRCVFISFGSITTSVLMPDAWKQSIVEVARRMPDTTFIWKYERPADFPSPPANLVCVEWAPQVDLLHDSRLSLFITHAGMGSVNEGLRAGVSMIAIPVIGDQFRNAQLLKRTGAATIYNKFDLAKTSRFEDAVRTAIESKELKQAADRNALMLRHRPFEMKEIFVRNMEFMARFGPLRMLDHYGRNLSTLQYYNLDLFLYPALLVLLIGLFVLLL
ncbi:hypothetical protein PRIPAC_73510 [Pristionchus pacificus]|uniref:glucuronosyltransferase n=1 Tax=Pristionchus pacificus TaxID=54126 RepID=A0A2A6BFB7_PRIPA|nr:hypothetical protein PRIPAC_73510 [Pristionchus pacificus]|eukprot:PDM64556.1 Glycosyltransferase [Pristionchus pacificus]